MSYALISLWSHDVFATVAVFGLFHFTEFFHDLNMKVDVLFLNLEFLFG